MLQQQTPTNEALPSPILDSQPTTSIKDYLFNIGKTYNTGGIDSAITAMASDATMRDKLTPDHIQALAYSPQKKTDTPEQIAVAGLAGGMATTNIAEQLAQKYGINLQQPKANSPQQVTSFTQGVQQALEQLKVDPASPEGQANQAYFGALFRGAGIKGAVDTYAKIYQKALERDSLLRNTVLAETIKRDIKLQETQALQQQFTSTATKTLASSGVATEAIPQLSQQIGQVLVTAKENPALAQGSAQSIIQNLIDSNAPTPTINKVAAMMSKAMDISKDDSDQVRALQAADASDRLIARYRFGLQDAKDAREAQELLEAHVRKQGEAKNQLEIDKAKALVPVEVDKHRQTKAIDVGAEKTLAKFRNDLELATAEQKQYSQTIGTKRGEAMAALPSSVNAAVGAVETIAELRKSMDSQFIQTNVGIKAPIGALLSKLPGTQSRDFDNILETLHSKQFLAAFSALKGGGQISNEEGRKAEAALAKLDKYSSVEDFNRNLDTFQTSLVKMIEENRKFAETGKPGPTPVPLAPAAPDSKKPTQQKVLKYNPQTGKVE